MPSPEVEEFAKCLVEMVRDRTIRSCDNSFLPQANGPRARRWKSLREKGSGSELSQAMISDCVDAVISNFLDAIDNGAIRLLFKSESGKIADLKEEGLGELAGWYMGTDSWRHMYSKERFFDDDADIKNFDFGK